MITFSNGRREFELSPYKYGWRADLRVPSTQEGGFGPPKDGFNHHEQFFGTMQQALHAAVDFFLKGEEGTAHLEQMVHHVDRLMSEAVDAYCAKLKEATHAER